MEPQRDWRRFEGRPPRLILLGTVAVLCLAIIGYLVTEVRQKLAELAYSPADNMQWTLSQFEVEYLELMLAASVAMKLEASDAETLRPALAEVRKRYDILYSRVETLSQSQLYNEILRAETLGPGFSTLETGLREMIPVIDGPDPRLAAALPDMRHTLIDLRGTVRDVLTNGNQALVELADNTRNAVALVLFRLVIASLVLLAALSLLVLMFRQVAAQNERRTWEVLTTSARLETIFSTSRDAILVLDRRGTIETANDAAAEMFGRSREGLAGLGIGQYLFHTSETPTPLGAGDLDPLCSEADKTALRLIGRSAQATFPVEVSMNVTDREGAAVYVCVIRDISHQVAAEAELTHSRDRALAGERAKARFLGVVSHEMRTPLNDIIGALELMQDARAEDIQAHYLPVLRNSSSVLLDLVNDVLEITRIEGRVAVEPVVFDLDHLIASVLDAEQHRAQAHDNALHRAEEPPVGPVTGDRRRVRQILLNLVSNAAKFTRAGRITVSAERLSGDRVEIQVADTGIGIAEADLETIFDDFVRTDSANQLQIQGTGLGLGIARQLARSMRGDIGVESIEGEGSIFRVTLLLPAASSADLPAARPETAQAAPRPGPRLEILMAEDNATNRFVTRRMLTRQGHAVTEAHDGEEAVQKAGERPFDLILMDVSMPRTDGIEATRLIRSGHGPNRATRIVALTAHVGDDLVASLKRAGMDGVLAKPLTGADLSGVVADTLSLAQPVPPGHDTPTEESPLPILDPDQIGAILSGDANGGLPDRLDRFLSEGAAAFGKLESGPGIDPGAAAPVLHDFAGSAAVFGARRLHAALVEAETHARDGNAPALAASIARARPLWQRTRAAMLDRRPDRAAERTEG